MNELRTLVWLRWRLAANQWARNGTISRTAGVALPILMGALAAAIGVIGFLVGDLWLAQADPKVLVGACDVVVIALLFFWLTGLLQEVQRSEALDVTRLLHLPVSLRRLVFLNFAGSLVRPTVFFFVAAIVGLALGLGVAGAPVFLLLVPVGLALLFALSAWTYCLQGWVANLMRNERRRRSIVVMVSTTVILLSQGPNLYFNVFRGHGSSLGATDSLPGWVHIAFPPLWLGWSASGIADGTLLPTIVALFAASALGVGGLFRAWQGTQSFYTAANTPASRGEKPPAPRRSSDAVRKMTWRVPGLPDDVAAVFLVTLKNLWRVPEARVALASQFVFALIFLVMFTNGRVDRLPSTVGPMLCIFISAFTAVQLLTNHFGYDRTGFCTYVLSPCDRSRLLLGKNLALGVALFGIFLVLLTGGILCHRVSAISIPATILQEISALLLLTAVGNVVSIHFPTYVRTGSTRRARVSGSVSLVHIGLILGLPLLLLPALFPGLIRFFGRGVWTGFGVEFAAAGIVALAATGAYLAHLPAAAAALERRQTLMLRTLTEPPD